jgi:hypothetical protein
MRLVEDLRVVDAGFEELPGLGGRESVLALVADVLLVVPLAFLGADCFVNVARERA